MTTISRAQHLHRCARALRRAECSLASNDPLRTSALMAARDEIDTTLRTLRRHPWPRVSPAVMAVAAVCAALLAAVGVKTAMLLTEGRPAVEARQ